MKFVAGRLLLAACIAVPGTMLAGQGASPGSGGTLSYVDQGSLWTDAARSDFYSRDQGSQMIPLAWLKALQTADGHPFLADKLARYGYLPNPASDAGLPVGFTASGPAGSEVAGMTCAACHTRQIEVDGQAYRIDGGPALVDFQAFLHDLDAAMLRVASDDAAFTTFSTAVLGSGAPPAEVAQLKSAVRLWSEREHTLMTKALPANPWGLGRLDAVAMIFNRLTGLDLGPSPTYLIADNIQVADAPVRYPFLWNAAIQDKTQWPGFADNGNDILGLARNLGEVYGVFATFHPKKDAWRLSGINFTGNNSANFDGLSRLEQLIRKIGTPKWPWAIDPTLVQQGGAIFARPTAQGGCAECHAEKPGTTRFLLQKTWATPILDVGTDSREYDILKRTAQSGVLDGAKIPFVLPAIKKTDTAFNLLSFSVVGSILQNYTGFLAPAPQAALGGSKGAAAALQEAPLSATQKELAGAFRSAAAAPPAGQYPYESRVLYGIWAAAPYLHNGSVATLADLLQPVDKRAATFAVGRYYDTSLVGLAADQHGSPYSRTTTDCSDRNSGNSRCGHLYGTSLSEPEKRALLEYMKTL